MLRKYNIKQLPSKLQENAEGDLLTKLRIADHLSAEHILDISEGRIMAVLIQQYCQPQIAELGASRIIKDSGHKLKTYKVAKKIGRRGMAFYDTNDDSFEREKYFQTASETAGDFRDIFHPYLSPLDKFRLELSEKWKLGANIQSLGGRSMSPAIIRVFGKGSDALPHQDNTSWDAPFEPDANQLICQLSALTYLKMSNIGGEVELWNKRLSEAEYNEKRFQNSYGLDVKLIGEPDLVVKPKSGDLLIFNASKVHAVQEILEGVRVTISSFVGFSGRYKPLSVFQ